jgi:HAMP domain-containing protein
MLSLKGLTGRITSQFFVIVSLSIIITSIIGYVKLYEVTAKNADIRIDRAARAAASIFTLELPSEYAAINGESGQPIAVRLKNQSEETSLVFRQEHDDILHKIGITNQGAANLFKLNQETKAFDRFSTTFRKPDGTMPPPMSIQAGHPAYDDIINNRPHIGEGPVMGRMRFAYLTPIQLSSGKIAGALAVDVGWVDELTAARNELQSTMIITTILILLLVAAFGMIRMSSELKPLRKLANYADDLAKGINNKTVPYKYRSDEVGILAQGIDRIGELQIKLQDALYKQTNNFFLIIQRKLGNRL